jgi:hypothetical protein
MADEKDSAQADAACCGIRPGQIYRHYKGGLYTIREVAVKEDTLEILVIYQSNARGSVWARTLANFVEVGLWADGHGLTSRFTREED